MAFLELHDIAKSYGGRAVVSRIFLSVEEGEFVSIVGGSASGKTTLLKIASGLVEADRGTVTAGGERVNGFPRDAAIVFQNYSLLPWFSALENVRLAVEAAFPQWTTQQQKQQSQKYLEMVGLGSAMAKRPSQLSGGMRQRVAIARAFAVTPRVLFLDEPFGALDAMTRSTLQQELMKMCTELARPVTALMITNSVDEAILLSDRILTLGRGPGSTLSPAVPVTIGRPRAVDLLLHDEQAVRIRSSLAEFLVSAHGPARGPAGSEAGKLRADVAVEAGA